MTKASVDFERNKMLPVVLMYQPIPAGIEVSIAIGSGQIKSRPDDSGRLWNCSA
jgi:hypothetical protein